MIQSAWKAVKTWIGGRIPERGPDSRSAWPTMALLVFTAAGAFLLWFRVLPTEINLVLTGMLLVAFILWPLRFGYLGAIISAIYLVSGSYFTLRGWFLRDDLYYLSIAVAQLATLVSGIIIAGLVERERRQRKELERAAIVDGLTGLYNHKHFVFRIQQEIARTRRAGEETALIYIDLDKFKPVNDTFGHHVGDSYLRAFALLMVDVLRADDTAYRLGGDEFAIILPATSESGARRVAERLREEMETREMGLPNEAIRPSASVGISVAPKYAETAAELMTQADSALYHAKHAGRDQIRLFKDVFTDILTFFSSGNEDLIWSLKSLLWSAAARDHYTYGHSERVSDYSTALAAEIGLPPDQVSSIRIAGILHDIGRVQVPQELLLRTGALTASELHEVRRHPEYAAQILSPLAGIGTVVDDVRYHHERYDGKGYPGELSGEDIPIGSRVISVCDAFDAMCTDRPYRRALTMDQAIREIRKGSGTVFDPTVVAAAIELLPELALGTDGHTRYGLRAV